MKNARHSRDNIQNLYSRKLKAADSAVEELSKDLRFVTLGCYAATPVALSKALVDHMERNTSASSIEVYLFRSSSEVVSIFNRPKALERIKLIFPFMGGEIGTLMKTAQSNTGNLQYPEYCAGHFSRYESNIIARDQKPDLHMFQVSPMDEHGYFSFGLDGSFSIPMSRLANKVAVEVNENVPRTFGDGIIHISQVDAIVEHNSDVLKLPSRTISPTDQEIAKYLIDEIKDGSCIQLGIGGVPDAVGNFLTNKNDLGVHTELLSSSIVDLILDGNITNAQKEFARHRTVFNVAMMPTDEYYEVLNNNPSMLCYPASVVNNPKVISSIENMISVNSFVEIDLFGQVASESISWHQITGSGGQVDFVRGASMSKGGKSFLAAHSTAKNGSVSKIVPKLNNIVTTARTDVQYVCTEFGLANLAGMPNHERAKSLIGLAHPNFRDELTEQASKMGLVS